MLERIRRWFAADSELKMAEGERFLIVGLGNPGKKHQKNRHNIGFMAVDRLAGQNEIPLGKVQSKAVLGNGRIAGQQVILAKPQTYMNRSGDSVGPLVNYYRVPLENVLVIYDELDLPFGTLRLRQSGGSGGHNGMKSIINHLGQDFPRMRLGIGRPPGRMEPADFVLRDFRGQELEVADALLNDAVLAVETYLTEGIDLAMTKHNGSGQ
ncbi:MAG: aminoacyl-tRNA hydrolase [Candidatus Promineifilaceae bacterium]